MVAERAPISSHTTPESTLKYANEFGNAEPVCRCMGHIYLNTTRGTDRNMKTRDKTYTELREELNETEPEFLDESRFLRGASALLFASNAKMYGNQLVANARQGKSVLSRIKPDTPTETQIKLTAEALDHLFDCLISGRSQIGNLVGISLASTLISERSTKELTKILKQRR